MLIATANEHKAAELRDALAGVAGNLATLADAGLELPEPDEDQPTLIANAQLKARYYARHTARLCLADDSGLAVDALGGAPGVHSARFAGAGGSRADRDAANNRKLVAALGDVPDRRRTAHFECVMALADAHKTWAVVRGRLSGRIVDRSRGRNGFGYDPHFYLPERDCCIAELSADQKNAISHRG
ncbi:MAG: RdgB/HAM1 family non-canonical purine NTP pyrophosphatase, partial [Alphaproteobacteria bacterium]|nr:RdgB/HAM1 family non-canonical purine NTP pyrophosphatase [Alphaproteobacteria bacterium]